MLLLPHVPALITNALIFFNTSPLNYTSKRAKGFVHLLVCFGLMFFAV